MNWIPWYILAAAVPCALLALTLSGVFWMQAAGRVGAADAILALDIEATHKKAALDYIAWVDAQISVWRILWDHVRAPFVLLIPLLRLPWEADDLPDSLAYWRNDVSINGDGWVWQDALGAWCQCAQEKEPPGVVAVRYGDPVCAAPGCIDAYYAPGHHPRSWYARWVWLAFRNVASARMLAAGPRIETRPVLLDGAPLDGPGFALFWNGQTGAAASYQWHSAAKWGPLLLYTNMGAKLGVAYQWPEVMPCRAMLIATWRAFKWGG